MSTSRTVTGAGLAFLILAARLLSQESAPTDAEAYERTLREERVRHADQVRKLADEEDRLRAALDAARGRLAEADARRASLKKLLAQAAEELKAVQAKIAAGQTVLREVGDTLSSAVERLASRAPAPADLVRDGTPLVRRARLFFQTLDREIASARSITIAPRERAGVLGHELRLGLIARFFVPTADGAAILEPSGRALPEPVGSALREVVAQISKRGRGTLVRIPWWGAP